MNIRQAEIAKALTEWLESYSPPRSMAGNIDAMQRESERLLSVLTKFAPSEGYNGWVASVLEQCAYQMKTRAWPTVGELGAVCSNARKSRQGDAPRAAFDLDVHELNASRMKAGEAVGEGYLYGREAVELIARGLVDRELMTRYRSAAFLSRKKMHGEDAALAWEADAKARHEDAKAARKERVAA
jgi:hypothetical protein